MSDSIEPAGSLSWMRNDLPLPPAIVFPRARVQMDETGEPEADPQWESRLDQLLAAVREGAGEHRSLQVHRERRDAPTPWRIYGLTWDELVAQMRASRRYWEGDLYEI